MSRLSDVQKMRGAIPLDIDNFYGKFNQGFSFNSENQQRARVRRHGSNIAGINTHHHKNFNIFESPTYASTGNEKKIHLAGGKFLDPYESQAIKQQSVEAMRYVQLSNPNAVDYTMDFDHDGRALKNQNYQKEVN